MKNKRFVLLGLVLFMMLCFLASPMPMGEMGHVPVVEDSEAYLQFKSDYDFQTERERDFFVQKGYTISALTTNIEYMDEVVGTISLGSTTANIALGRDYVMSRTMFTFEWGNAPTTDDSEDTEFGIHWKDANELTLIRGDNDFTAYVYINLIEFTAASGVIVEEYGPYSSAGAIAVTSRPVANTLILPSGCSTVRTYYTSSDYNLLYLDSATQVGTDTSAIWSNMYFQQVYVPNSAVQRGKDAITTSVDITVDSVDTTRTSTFASVMRAATAGGWDHLSAKAHFTDSTSLLYERAVDLSDSIIWWQLIEWPSGWFLTQDVHETGMGSGDTSEATTISEVIVANSVAWKSGAMAGAGVGGISTTEATDQVESVFIRTDITSTTVATSTRGTAGDTTSYYVHILEVKLNAAPVNDATPTCTNLDDGDNLYARYKLYEFSCSVTDADGFEDINYVELRSYDYDTTTLRWSVRFDEDTATFSEQAGATYIALTGSTNVSSGVNLDITFKMYIEWAHPDVNDDDLYQYVCDDEPTSDGDSYPDTNYDYDTDLTTTFALSDGSGNVTHGDYNSLDSITASGTVSYEDSGGNNYPPDSEVDMYIRCADVAGSDWNDNAFSSGAWSVTVDSDDVIGLDTYYVKAVQAGGNYDSATLLGATTSALYVADRVRVVSYTIVSPSGDNRNNVGTTYTIDVELHYDLYETDVVDGTVTVNGESMDSYQGSGKWRWTPTQAGVIGITYNNVQVTGNANGVTKEDNTVTQLIIWDRIKVVSYTIVSPVGDNRNNIGTTYTIDIELHYDYDETDVADGTITVNGESMDSYQGLGKWRWTPTQAGVTGITYNNMQATGNTHGITEEDNTVTQLIIWDRVRVVSYTIVTPLGDNRNNIGTTYTIDIELHYDYDEFDVADGTITVNGESMDSYQGSGKWRWTPYQAGMVGITYNNMQATGNAHGITAEDNTVTQLIIWDRVQVQSYTVTDDWVNINDNVNIDFLVWYDYDDTQVTDGDFTLNGYDATHQGSGVWRIPRTSTSPTMVNYNTVLVSAANTHGIDVEDQNGKSRQVVWDSVTISITGPTDNRQNLNANASGIHVTITMDYNATAYGGTATMNNTDYNGDGTAVRWGYTVSSVSGGTEGITTISSNDDTYMIWDSLTITITGPTDNRQNINANASGIGMSAVRDYDSSAFDGTLTMNNTDYNGDGTVVRWGYTISSASGGTYGITTISSNDDTYMIWDQVKVLGYSTNSTDNHDNINDGVNITVWIQYDYDDTNVTDGTIAINSESFAYNAGTGNWTAIFSNATASSATWNIAVAAGNTHGITDVNQNSKSQNFKWDSLTIALTDPTDQRQNLNANATGIHATATYDLGGAYDGTLVMNNTDYNGDGTVIRWGYKVASATGDDTYGITAISDDSDETYMIWDRIIILTTTTDDGRIDISTAAAITATAKLEYDNHDLGTGDTLYINGTSAAWNGSHFLLSPNFAVVGIWSFFVNSTNANEATYGITLINLDSNTVNQIFDSLTMTASDPTDQRIDVSTNMTAMGFTAVRDYDSTAFTGTLVLNDTTYDHGTVGIYYYIVASASGGADGITAIGTNDNTYCIFDRIKILTTAVTDTYIEYGTESTTVNVTAELEYDAHALGSGDTLYMNNTEMTWDTDHYYIVFGPYSVVGSWSLFVNSSSANEATHTITVINLNGQSDTVATDRVKVISYAISDARDNVDDYIWINVTVQYESDSAAVTDGTIVINSYSFTHLGSGIWRHNRTQASAAGITFDTAVAASNTRGITVVNQNGQSQLAVWDSYTISFTVGDNRININVNATVGFTVISDYDSIHYDGTRNLNYSTWTQTTAQRQGFTMSSLSGDDTYGITVISTNDADYIIWDSYTVSFTVGDNRINININATVGYTVISDYDSIAYDGTVNLNYTTWEQANVQRQGFTVSSLAGDDTYGITAIKTNDADYVIWDAIGVYMWISDGRDNVDDTITVYAWLTYLYDRTNVSDGTVLLNGTGMNYASSIWSLGRSQTTVGLWAYNITSISGNTYGITIVGEAKFNSTYVELMDDNGFPAGNSSRTVTAWVYVKSYPQSLNHIFHYGNNAGGQSWGLVTWSTGGFGVHEWGQYQNVGSVPLNEWVFLVITMDEDGVKLHYMNGEYVGTETYIPNTVLADTPKVGSRVALGEYFDGYIGEVQLYSRVLSSDEIYELYQGRYSDDTGLVLRIDMSSYDVADEVWHDLSGNSNNGTIVNAVAGEIEGSLYVRPIWDQIKILGYTTNSTDNRDNIGTYVNISVWIQYDYDDVNVTDGTIVINSESFAYNAGSGNWTAVFSNATYSYATWDTVVASGNTYGITNVNQNSKSQLYVWDEIEVYYGQRSDGRTNVDEQEYPYFRLRLKYDNHLINDSGNDAVWINGSVATWSGGLFWYKYYTQSSVGTWNFVVTSVSENTYGITSFDSASAVSYDKDIIWDRVIVMGYNTNSTDNRDNINDCFNVSVWIQYEYDSTNVTDGTIVINSDAFAYNSGSGNWTALFSNATVSDATWDTIVASGNTHGITYENQNSKSQTVVWDRVQVQTTVVDDGRVNYGTTAQIRVTLWLDYDDSYLGSGDTVNLNGTGMSWDAGNSWFELDRTFSVVGEWSFFVNSTSEATYGITVLDLNGQSVNVIWDRILILTTTTDDGRIDYNTEADIAVTAELEYDSHSLGSGDTLYMNGTVMSWNGSHFILNPQFAEVGIWGFYVNSSSANEATYGITVINLDGNSVNQIWDRILISTTVATDGRIDYGATTIINVTATLEYAAHILGSEDTLYMNDTIMIWDTDHFYLVTGGYNIVDLINYFVNSSSANEATHGITVINLDGNSADVIWDRIIILTTVATDGRIDYGTTTTINVTATLEYAVHSLGSGDTLYMNDTSMTWDTNHYYIVTGAYNIIDLINYFVNSSSANEATYGINVVNLDGYSADVIWDQIIVRGYSTNSTDNRDDINDVFNVTVWLQYAYDSTNLTDGFVANDEVQSRLDISNVFDLMEDWVAHDFDSWALGDGILNLTTAGDNDYHSLRYLLPTDNVEGWTFYIRCKINVTSNTGFRAIIRNSGGIILETIDIGRSTSWTTRSATFTISSGAYWIEFDVLDYTSPTLSQVDWIRVETNDMYFIYSGQGNWSCDITRDSVVSYTFDSIGVTKNTYGIVSMDQDSKSQQLIWDRIKILTTVTDDNRVGYDTQATIIVTAQLEYDYHVLGSGDVLYMNGTQMTWNGSHFILNPQFAEVDIWSFYVNSTNANEATYGITSISLDGNSVNQIWDRIVFTWNSNMTWTIVNYNINVSFTAIHEYDSVVFAGNLTAANCTITNSTTAYEGLTETPYENYTYYTTSVIDDVYGITSYINTLTAWCVFDNITATAVYGTDTGTYTNTFYISFGMLKWLYNGSGIGADWICDNIRNGTALTFSTTRADSLLSPDIKQEISVSIDWDAILYSNNATKTIGGRSYDFQWYSIAQVVAAIQDIVQENTEILDTVIVISGTTNVDFTWTIYNEDVASGEIGTVSDNTWEIIFDMVMVCGVHNYSIYFNAGDSGTRWFNNSYFIDFDVNIDPPEVRNVNVEVRGTINIACNYYVYHEESYSSETGSLTPTTFSFFFTKMTDVGLHNYSLHFNVSASIATWKNGSYYVSADIYDCHIVILNSLYELIPFDTFEVYNNGTRTYHDIIRVTDGYVYNITIKNRFGDYVNTTAVFDAAREMVVFVNVFSLKFWSAYEGFCELTVSRGGVDYSEILMPMEIVNFRLYRENYTYSIDYLDDTIMSGNINLLASTGVVITNDTVSDIFGLVDAVWDMGDDINITVTTIEDNSYTIQLMFDWTNTTLYNQSVTVLSSFNWDNTTIYNQTISLLSAFNATNTVLYNQIVLIQNMFNWENTTLYNQTISILNAFNATNTVIYEQTISILSNISSMNSTIYSQTIDILTNVENINSTLYAQTLDILTDIVNVNSTIYAQTVSILSDISNVNTTIYAQALNVLSNITNVNSTIFSQTVDIISYVWNSVNSIYNQTIDILSDIQNTNTTIYTQTVSMLSQITNVNSTIYSQTVDILNYIWNSATSIYNQTVTVLSDISNVNVTLYAQTVTLLSNIENVNSTIYSQTVSILSNISNVNTTLYAQTVSILSNIENVNSTLYAQTLTILSDISNLNSTVYDQAVTMLSNIQNLNTTIYQQTIDILTNITNVNSTIYSQVLSIVNNLAELNATIHLVDDPTNLNFLIAGYAFSDDYCDLTIVSSWHNATLTIYENGVSKVGPVSELLGPVRHTLNETIGSYNLSVYVDAGVDSLWYNISYVVDGMEYGQVNLYNSRGTGLDDTYFVVYINGSRYFGNRFYNRSDYVYNVTVTDYFGYVILQSTYDWAYMIDVGIDFYVYKVKNEVQGQAIYFNLTRTGGAKFSQHLLADEILTYYLVAGEYTYEFRKVTTAGGSTYVYYEGTFTLSTDKTHIIDGTNLRDLENDIELIPAGKADIKPLEEKMGNILGMISMMQFGMWGLAFLIVMGMAATATEGEVITKDGKKVKKRKIPKQLKRFAFKRGAQNPKSVKIPKGAGRKSWKGVSFRDEIEDWRKKK